MKIKGKFISTWENGEELVSDATLDNKTGEIVVDEVFDDADRDALIGEIFVDSNGKEYAVCSCCHECTVESEGDLCTNCDGGDFIGANEEE